MHPASPGVRMPTQSNDGNGSEKNADIRPFILCFSHLRWNFVYQRPQHLKSRVASHVGCNTFPTIVANDRPARIQRLGRVVERLNIVPLRRAVGKVRNAPAFVERHPCHYARMAAVALQRLQPLSCQPLNRLCCVAIRAWRSDPRSVTDYGVAVAGMSIRFWPRPLLLCGHK